VREISAKELTVAFKPTLFTCAPPLQGKEVVISKEDFPFTFQEALVEREPWIEKFSS